MIFGRIKPLDAILATAEKKALPRSLGAFQLTMLGIGAIIGTGIFVLTAEAAQKAIVFEAAGDKEQAQTWRRVEAALLLMRGPRQT